MSGRNQEVHKNRHLMHIALIFPRCKYPSGDPPLGIMYIASELKKMKGVQVDIIDTTFVRNPKRHIQRCLKNKKYDLIGFSVMTSMLKDACEMAAVVKAGNPGTKVIFGGSHPTVAPKSTLENENVDAVCIGEGEKTMRGLIEADIGFGGVEGIWFKQGGEIIKNQPRHPVEDLDDLEMPSRDLLDMRRYFREWFQLDAVSSSLRGTNLIASRGCPYACSYCQPTLSTIFGKKIRKRSPGNIIEEILFLKDTYKIDAFSFDDDTFIIDKDWVSNICDEMMKNRVNLLWGCNVRANLVDKELMLEMKTAGLRRVMMGIESGSQRILDDVYNKRITIAQVKDAVNLLKGMDIKVLGHFMIGAPTETEEEILDTIKFAKGLDIDAATFSITTPMPHTYLYERTKGGINQSFEEFDYYKTPVYNDRVALAPFKILSLKRRAFAEFYLSPKRLSSSSRALFSSKTYNMLKRL